MFEYSVGWITSSFGKSKIMGMDKVYLQMLNRYYCTDNSEGNSPAFWVAKDKFEDLCDNLKTSSDLQLVLCHSILGFVILQIRIG